MAMFSSGDIDRMMRPAVYLFVGSLLLAFAVGGFVVWCVMHFGGAQ